MCSGHCIHTSLQEPFPELQLKFPTAPNDAQQGHTDRGSLPIWLQQARSGLYWLTRGFRNPSCTSCHILVLEEIACIDVNSVMTLCSRADADGSEMCPQDDTAPEDFMKSACLDYTANLHILPKLQFICHKYALSYSVQIKAIHMHFKK